jgi:deoxycytidylate deaminase
MYTSTEPCPMCSGGIRYAGLGRIVYSVSAEEVVEFTGREPATRADEILDCAVVGPVSNAAGRAVHEAYW